MPVYEYRCTDCEQHTDRILPHDRVDDPGACPSCDGELRRLFSRVGVKLQGWGFNQTDGMVPDRPGRGDFRTVSDRADRIASGDTSSGA